MDFDRTFFDLHSNFDDVRGRGVMDDARSWFGQTAANS